MTAGTRQFPCTSCGAKVEFAPGTDALECPYCGSRTAIPESREGVVEHDFMEAIQGELGADAETEEVTSV
ncbi:MAG: hypothetical protein R3253_17245, partial [Longimicrobiales bacterium]|nr:hypothetical protein [Longimicrobiales bacterium]